MTVGEKIKYIRKEKGLTQKELGIILGDISQQQIGQWETGKANPKIETLEKIANALGVSVSVFRDFSEYKQNIIDNSPALSAYQRLGYLDSETLAQDSLRHSMIESLDMTEDKQELIYNYNKLNESGQTEARKRIQELTEIPKYQKDNE